MPTTLPRLFAALLACAIPASLAASPRVDLAVVDRETGQWLAPIRHDGERWIAGTPGHRYALRLTNTTGQRVLVVLSVDGVNAITGQIASPSQAGYVLEPWQTAQVDGWRKSTRHVAQFVFTDLPDSYAARTGRPDNVGVIGVAVYEEARPWRAEPPVGIAREERRAQASASRATDEAAAQSIGTGHGAREWSQARETTFVRAHGAPSQVIELRYDDRRSLVARGVLPYRDRPYVRRPQAFPDGFVADPPGEWE